MHGQIDDLIFIGSHLSVISRTGKVGVRNARTQVWQKQALHPISSHDRAGTLLLLGCQDGTINYVDLEKFPLRMKDNDLLVNRLYGDPAREPITALSVYLTPSSSSEQCLEIAYGTASGNVRVIIQVSLSRCFFLSWQLKRIYSTLRLSVSRRFCFKPTKYMIIRSSE